MFGLEPNMTGVIKEALVLKPWQGNIDHVCHENTRGPQIINRHNKGKGYHVDKTRNVAKWVHMDRHIRTGPSICPWGTPLQIY